MFQACILTGGTSRGEMKIPIRQEVHPSSAKCSSSRSYLVFEETYIAGILNLLVFFFLHILVERVFVF